MMVRNVGNTPVEPLTGGFVMPGNVNDKVVPAAMDDFVPCLYTVTSCPTMAVLKYSPLKLPLPVGEMDAGRTKLAGNSICKLPVVGQTLAVVKDTVAVTPVAPATLEERVTVGAEGKEPGVIQIAAGR